MGRRGGEAKKWGPRRLSDQALRSRSKECLPQARTCLENFGERATMSRRSCRDGATGRCACPRCLDQNSVARRFSDEQHSGSWTKRAGQSSRAQPTVGGSTYVKPRDMDWGPTQFPGVSIKVLYEAKDKGEMTCLLKWAPGASLPMHKHPEIEQTYVIEGAFYDHDGICRAGEYVWLAHRLVPRDAFRRGSHHTCDIP